MRTRPPPITISDAAQEHIRSVLSSNPGMAFRIGVDNKGCAGHKYLYGLIELNRMDPTADTVSGDWGTVVIDRDSILYLLGSKLELKVEGLNSQLVMSNPLAGSTCGCGESFSLASEGCTNAEDTNSKTLF